MFELTTSPFWVGLIAGLQGLALVMFGVLGGAVVDRLDKRIVLAVVHFGSFSVASIVGMLVIFSDIKIWHLMLSAVLQGLFMATQLPASNTLAYQLVGPARLMNAMAARLAGMNLTRLIGSLIAGTLIAQDQQVDRLTY
jgi:MFS family permease